MRFPIRFPALCFMVACVTPLASSAASESLVEAGIPSLEREWYGPEYTRAAQVLASGKVPLPTNASDEGKAFLQRLTDTQNFSLHRNRTIPIGSRLEDFLDLTGAANSIMKLYAGAANHGAKLNVELAQGLAFSLRMAALGVELIDEVVPTIPKDDKYPVRMAGLKQFYSGTTTIFAGVEASLSERKFYSSHDFGLMLDAMVETLPNLKKAFPPDYLTELRLKLEARKADFAGDEGAKKIEKLIAELKE